MKIKAKNEVYEPLTQEKLDALLKIGELNRNRDGYASLLIILKNERRILILLNDGSGALLNVDNYNELRNLSDDELDNLSIGFSGKALCHNELDIHISIQGLMENSDELLKFSSSSLSSLRETVKSDTKIKLSRENGKKGGRLTKKKNANQIVYTKKIKHEN
ncbi:TPA: DUF2442 domain-containing protein [Yersinia enterocolitica]|uniref:DUF2442 domain-containing protein n=1 Tax=Yersinia enterocolitica TaxID=630 RepID=UPI0005E80713|nr:DUF2442 domain-containing protein [Yersinia enterocolitica]CQJ65072.1 Protein of uncharacterised function (DUF3532) [Yersinia enterocolitica]